MLFDPKPTSETSRAPAHPNRAPHRGAKPVGSKCRCSRCQLRHVVPSRKHGAIAFSRRQNCSCPDCGHLHPAQQPAETP